MQEIAKHRLPYGAAQRIAAATGYSVSYVRSVRQGKSSNELIDSLIRLATTDRIGFAHELSRQSEATQMLHSLPGKA